jgi:DUF2917 family protein
MLKMRLSRLRERADRRIMHSPHAFIKEAAMQLTLRKPNVSLDAGEVLTLKDAEGTSILARTGTVWVTEEGSREDRIIGPGETLVVAHAGRTVVQALKPSWISLGEGPLAANEAY